MARGPIWTEEEDETLLRLAPNTRDGEKAPKGLWEAIAKRMGRSKSAVINRYAFLRTLPDASPPPPMLEPSAIETQLDALREQGHEVGERVKHVERLLEQVLDHLTRPTLAIAKPANGVAHAHVEPAKVSG